VTRMPVAAPRTPLTRAVRKGALLLVVAALFLPFGVPRFLGGDDAPARANADARFATLCRDRGGTPEIGQGRRGCTIRYHGQVYVMDAITPNGFDADTARFQRQGCELARHAARAATGVAKRQVSFVYHLKTGVCEHRR
jgi:hypothetical protein